MKKPSKIIGPVLLFVCAFLLTSCPGPYTPIGNNSVSFYKYWYSTTSANNARVPGTTVYMDVVIKNITDSTLENVTGTLYSPSEFVTIIKNSHFYGDISAGCYKTCKGVVSDSTIQIDDRASHDTLKGYQISIDSNCPENIRLPFTLVLNDKEHSSTCTCQFTLTIGNPTNTDDPFNSNTDIPKEYWGTWIQMDTGTEYYIDDEYIYELHGSSKSIVQKGKSNYVFESEEVLKSGSTVFFRKGGKPRGFSVSFSGFSDDDGSGRAADGTNQKIVGKRKNKNIVSDAEMVEASDNSTLEFTEAVAGDTQTVTVSRGAVSTSVDLTPRYSGENLGTIPLVEEGTYGFKTTYSINSDEQGFCFGNLYKTYTLTLNLNNIGFETCDTSQYDITCNDPNFQMEGDLHGNFSSLEPGMAREISLNVRYAELTEEYVDVPITISIIDSKYLKTWNDTVVLRFYRGLVALSVNSRNFDSNSRANLNGFVIYPDGRSKRFTVSAGTTEQVLIPWSTNDYTLVFSGATTTNEMAYSFGFTQKTSLADLSGQWSVNDIIAYEGKDSTHLDANNDSVANAAKITDLSVPAKAYLKYSDIDFYTINNSSLEIGFQPVTIYDSWKKESVMNGDFNNGDGEYNPGEVIYTDIVLKNNTDTGIEGISATLSSTSAYVTIDSQNATHSYGDISAGYYKNCNDKTSNNTNYVSNSSYVDSSKGFKFTISENCPANTEIPFTLTFTDLLGSTWTDTFSITVVNAATSISYRNYWYNDSTSLGIFNNGDKTINPGEVITIDVIVQNSGTGLGRNISATLSSSSEYVTIDSENATHDYGNISVVYYKNCNDKSSDYYSSVNNSSYVDCSKGFKFTISEDCPVDTEIPFTLTFTDLMGNTCTDTFNISVVKTGTNIAYYSSWISDSTSLCIYNNANGKYNPGEVIIMDVVVENIGTSLGRNISSTLSSTSEFVTINISNHEYGDIKAGYYKNCNDKTSDYYSSVSSSSYVDCTKGFKFTISGNCPTNTQIPFTLTFTDEIGNTWTDTFNITVN